MKKHQDIARIQRFAIDAHAAEELFATVDETGHTNAETAKKQRARKRMFGNSVQVDPLSHDDPSGSNVEKVITLTAVSFVAVFFVLVVLGQVGIGYVRRASTANLATEVSVKAVASAMNGGVEWGNGFTQFPEHFSVQEADENTHRIEVTVVDTTSKELIEVFAGSQIQASALAVNALLNPKVNKVIYHVNVYFNAEGKLTPASLFGLLPPSSTQKTLMTFEWTKIQTKDGVRFNCSIVGVDKETQENLREAITSSFTPTDLLGKVLGTSPEGTNPSTSTTSRTPSAKKSNVTQPQDNDVAPSRDTNNEVEAPSGTPEQTGSSVAEDNSNSV